MKCEYKLCFSNMVALLLVISMCAIGMCQVVLDIRNRPIHLRAKIIDNPEYNIQVSFNVAHNYSAGKTSVLACVNI